MNALVSSTVNIKFKDTLGDVAIHFTAGDPEILPELIKKCMALKSKVSVLALFPLWKTLCEQEKAEFSYTINKRPVLNFLSFVSAITIVNFMYKWVADYNTTFEITTNYDGF